MSELIQTAPQTAVPLTLTWQELQDTMEFLTVNDVWANNTLRDLWNTGVPTPDSGPHRERRIIFPKNIGTWLSDILDRKGYPLDADARAFLDLYTGAKVKGE